MKCQAIMTIGDDYGDNEATMHCQLERGNKGDHQEIWNGYGSRRGLTFFAKLTWVQKTIQKKP